MNRMNLWLLCAVVSTIFTSLFFCFLISHPMQHVLTSVTTQTQKSVKASDNHGKLEKNKYNISFSNS